MVTVLTNVWLSFVAGLFAPLVAVCVLPLYPGFLAYLSNKLTGTESKKTIISLGIIATLGVIISMIIFGFIFTKLLQDSLTNAISIVSPIAFTILAIVSILLIFNVNIGNLFPKIHSPTTKNPFFSSFIFGLFFGAIVLPCNPASLIVLFALSTSTISFIGNFLNFVVFGIGMGLPLLLFAIISGVKSTQVINFLTRHNRKINLIAGIFMLLISLYYLICVFHVFGLDFGICKFINLPSINI